MTLDTRVELNQQSSITREYKRPGNEKKSFRNVWARHSLLYWFLLPALILLALFRLYPFYGVGIAFVDFNPVKGITGSEWVLGGWLLAGWRIQTGALLALIMYGLYAAGLVITLFRGIDLPNCGCYGVFFPQPLRWYSPFEDLVLVGMCYALWRSGKFPRTC